MENALRQHDPEFNNSGTANVQMAPGELHQLHIGLERLRAPELIFQPHMIGIREAGLAETIEFLLKKYTPEQQNRLVSNVFLTGGPAAFPGIQERLRKELMQIRPFQSKFQINIAKNTNLDSWYGARDFGLNENLSDYLITRKDYQEYGGEYLKVHSSSNLYFPSPDPLPSQFPLVTEQIIIEDTPVDVEID